MFYQYTLAQTSRINGKVKQRTILYLGSEKLLEDQTNRKMVLGILKSKIFNQPELFPHEAPQKIRSLAEDYYKKYRLKYQEEDNNPTTVPPPPSTAAYLNVDVNSVEVNDAREYGAENICKQMLEKLKLADCFRSISMTEEQTQKALISIASRAIYSQSEHKTAQILETNSELLACYGYTKTINHKQLYAVSDILYNNKSLIDRYLYDRITDMFDIKDKLVIFDISNTYFETGKHNSQIAKYGRSKEKRNDCPLVVFTGVINSSGFIRHSRIYEGNKPDIKTLSDMVSDMEQHTMDTEHIVVIDAGIADDENLKLLTDKGYKYVCVSRKRLREYPAGTNGPRQVCLTDRGKNKVELHIFKPKGYSDTWMYVESQAKREKENSMALKLRQRFEEELLSIKESFSKKGGTKSINKVWERIGRAKEKHRNVASRYRINVSEKEGKATGLTWTIVPNKTKDDKEKGVYFIRTNLEKTDENKLWEIYNTIREVESTFRCLKSDLNIRPVNHQKDERIEAHIYLTVIAYQLVNTIRYMLKDKGINHDWRNLVRIMSTQKIQTVKLPTNKKDIYIRKPSVPIKELKEIYDATGCTNTKKITRKYVVYH